MTDLHRYAVDPKTPAALDYYYANRTDETQQYLLDLLDLRNLREDLPTAFGTYGRGSAVYGCHRQHALDHLAIPEDYPFSGPTRLTFDIGSHIHAVVQTAWHFHYGAQVEIAVDLRPKGFGTSGHIDLVDGDVPVEIKSVPDFAFNKAVGFRGKPGEGPKPEHVVQGGTYGYGLSAERLRLVYINKGKHDGFFEWLIPMDVVEPAVVSELERLDRDGQQVADGFLPGRASVEFESIDNPPKHISKTGKWGKPFFCSGCRWNDLCRSLPSGPVRLSELEPQEDVA